MTLRIARDGPPEPAPLQLESGKCAEHCWALTPNHAQAGKWLPDKTRDVGRFYEAARGPARACWEGLSPWPLVLWGDSGVGKTCAALVLLDYFTGVYQTVGGLCEQLADARDNQLWDGSDRVTVLGVWRKWFLARLAVLDELGVRNEPSDARYETVLKAIMERTENEKPLVVISNLSPEQLKDIFDKRVSRRLSAGTVVHCTGDMRPRQGD